MTRKVYRLLFEEISSGQIHPFTGEPIMTEHPVDRPVTSIEDQLIECHQEAAEAFMQASAALAEALIQRLRFYTICVHDDAVGAIGDDLLAGTDVLRDWIEGCQNHARDHAAQALSLQP